LRKNEIATIFLKFKHLQLVSQSNKNKSNIEYYKNIDNNMYELLIIKLNYNYTVI